MALKNAYSSGFNAALQKFAVSGGMYARALEGAAQRGGGRVAPQLLGQIGATPRAQASPLLSQAARAPGALTPTPQQTQAQAIMERVPWAGREHGGTPQEAMHRYDQVLRGTGRVSAQPGLQQQMYAEFGRPAGHGTGFDLTQPGSTGQQTAVGKRRPLALEQTRKMGFDVGHALKSVAPYALGAAIPAATAAGVAMSKPELRANVKDLFTNSGSIEDKDNARPLPQQSMDTAALVQQALQARGLDPKALRYAVDAPPGTGKTTLSRAMAQQMGVKHYGLDWLPGNRWKRFFGGSHIEDMPRAPRAGEILEHYNLLRSYDPEMFDVAVHIKKDPEIVKQQIINRGRSAGAAAIMDYGKSNRVGDLAFDSLQGDASDLGNGVFMKTRPSEGWGAGQLDQQLTQAGIDPTGLSRHEKLLSLSEGKKQTGAGWRPYFKSPVSGGEAALTLGSIPIGIGAALAAKHLLR